MAYSQTHYQGGYVERERVYRARDGIFLGVCRGLERYSGLNAFWLRIALATAFVMTGFFPVIVIYVIAAIIMKPEPLEPPQSMEEWDFYNSYTTSREMALRQVRKRYEDLDRRISRIEGVVTDREFEWHERFRS